MEYLSGGSLLELLVDDDSDVVAIGGLLRLRIGVEISSGLAFLHNLHAKRMIHGDLKANNVLLTYDLHCKIADFGSSMASSYTGKTTTKYVPKHVPFTPIYAAPELLLNPTGKRAPSLDTYSFSIVIYLILKRELPISSKSMENVYLDCVKRGQRPDLSFINDLSTDFSHNDFAAITALKKVMVRCWAQDPSHRPAMADVHQKLLHEQAELDPRNEVISQVQETVKSMEIERPVRAKYTCEPLQMFQPPSCQFYPSGKPFIYTFKYR